MNFRFRGSDLYGLAALNGKDSWNGLQLYEEVGVDLSRDHSDFGKNTCGGHATQAQLVANFVEVISCDYDYGDFDPLAHV